MNHQHHIIFLLLSLVIFSAHNHDVVVTAAFLNSPRGGTTATTTTNNPQITTQQQPSSIIATAADAALALNSIDFMNLLSRRKNTADVRTFTLPISIDNDVRDSVHRNNSSSSNDESCRKKQQLSRLDNNENDDASLTLWPLLNVFFRNDKQQQQQQPPSNSCSIQEHHSSQTTTTKTTKTTSYKTVTEYKGILWFLPRKHSTSSIQFRETIRIISQSKDNTKSTIECLTEYYNGKRDEWIDCSRILCHFTSLNDDDDDEEEDATTQSKVKMTLDTKLLVWLPLPSMASRAVQKKIGSVFEEIVVEFLFGS